MGLIEGARERRALNLLKEFEGVIVALSGGVDSAVLAALALRALGPKKSVAITALSPAVPAWDRRDAELVAQQIGIPYRTIETSELADSDYRANRGDRCYYCRNSLFLALNAIRQEGGSGTIVYGAITDDLGDDRPGMRAAQEQGVRAPMLEAGMDKRDVRSIASRLQLSVKDKPAAACLSSRIPIGTEVTRERLSQVENAERLLHDHGFGQFRVRHFGDLARLELDQEGLRRIASESVRRRIVEKIREVGFERVEIDPAGYRTGSLNLLRKP